MAFVTEIRTSRVDLPQVLRTALQGQIDAWKRYSLYRTTLNELMQLTNRDLADLGIHRSAIRGIARETAYGDK